jgi:hypothetical protein
VRYCPATGEADSAASANVTAEHRTRQAERSVAPWRRVLAANVVAISPMSLTREEGVRHCLASAASKLQKTT